MNRKTGLKLFATIAATLAVALGVSSSAAPTTNAVKATTNFYECQGAPAGTPQVLFPEKRVWLENQAWLDNQPGALDAFGVPHGPHMGQQGHIHVGTCYPLNQFLGATGVVGFDVKMQLHNVDGLPVQLEVLAYMNGDVPGSRQDIPINGLTGWTCTANNDDCAKTIHVDFDLSKVSKSGWGQIGLWLNVDVPYNTTYRYERMWRNYNGWDVNFTNGRQPGNIQNQGVQGQSWLAPTTTNGSEYASGTISLSSMPWDSATGQFVPVSGVWRPNVYFLTDWESSDRFAKVMIDPNLHGTPPSEGTIVYDSDCLPAVPCDPTLSIDTTKLQDGPHKLLIMGKTRHKNGLVVNGQPPVTYGGVAITFMVKNNVTPPPTTTQTTTTSPTTTVTTTTTPVTTTMPAC